MELKGLAHLFLKAPMDIPDITSGDDDKEVVKLKKDNMKAYADLIICMDMKTTSGKAAMRLVVASKNEVYPRGNVSQEWKNLTRKFAPVTAAELTKAKAEYVNAKLKKNCDPDMFVDYLERLRARLDELGAPVDTRMFIFDILSKLGDEYDLIIERTYELLDSNVDEEEVILENLRDKLRAKYERMSNKMKEEKYSSGSSYYKKKS